jgi:hypothetical protein
MTDVAGVPVVPFADRLADAVERKRTQVVVGLDPVLEMLPVELRGEATAGRAAAASAVQRFCTGIVDAVAPYVVAVKPQVAFFEALGSDGWRALEHVSTHAREAGLLVIGDAKRGDVGSTARAYAAAFLERRDREPPLVDALTVSGSWPSSSTSGARTSSVRAGSRASAPSSVRPSRASSARRGGRCLARSSSCPEWVRRARPPRTSPGRSRAARPARSSTPLAP